MGRKEKGTRYAENMIERMLTQIANEDSKMGRDFRLRFDPMDPAGILKDLDGSTGIRIGGYRFSEFMHEQWKKGRISPLGALCFFTFGFFSNSELPNTIRMLKYVRDNVFTMEEYEKSKEELPLPTSENFPGMENSVVSKLTNYTIWKAMKGDEKIRNSLLAVYKKAFKREYNVMKKFSQMDYKDILHVISDDAYSEAEELMVLSRLLFFAQIKGIELQQPALFYELLNRIWEEFKEENGGFMAVEPLPEDYSMDYQEFCEAANLLEDEECVERVTEIFDSVLSNSEIDSSYSLAFNDGGMEKLEEIAPFYVAAINDSVKNATETEKTYGLVFAWIVNKAKKFHDEKMLECEQLLGMAPISGDDYMKEFWETSVEKETPAQASAARNALMDEIKNLKRELEAKEKELARQNDRINKLEKDLIAEEREKKRYKKMLEDQKKSNSEAEEPKEETERVVEEVKEISREEKIEFLKGKRICIVGGHQNWTYKVKELFPEWTFIKAKTSGTTSDEVIKCAERVFFFTDTLSHVSYARFVGLARTNGIPCSYLHAVNLDLLIDELYEEGLKEG